MDLTHFKMILFDWGDTLMRDDPTQSGPMAAWPQVEAILGAAETLATLKARGYRLAVATGAADSDESQIRQALGRVNLDRFFEKVYCFANTGQRKPAPGFYQFILNDLQLQPGEALMVGDNFTSDVLAANQVGIPAAWFNPSTPENRDGAAFFTLHHLEELLAVHP